MSRWSLLLHSFTAVTTLIALAAWSGAAGAAPRAVTAVDVFRSLGGTVTIPPEWDGIWSTVDSTYDCAGPLQGVAAGEDTLCSGQIVFGDPGGGLELTCTGFANATVIDASCSGTMELFPDCQVTYSVELDAVRTGDDFVATIVTRWTYDGTGEGCDFLPDECTRVVSRGHRTAPAPLEYCQTPARGETWGRLKLRYR